jgi:hypothetical protein
MLLQAKQLQEERRRYNEKMDLQRQRQEAQKGYYEAMEQRMSQPPTPPAQVQLIKYLSKINPDMSESDIANRYLGLNQPEEEGIKISEGMRPILQQGGIPEDVFMAMPDSIKANMIYRMTAPSKKDEKNEFDAYAGKVVNTAGQMYQGALKQLYNQSKAFMNQYDTYGEEAPPNPYTDKIRNAEEAVSLITDYLTRRDLTEKDIQKVRGLITDFDRVLQYGPNTALETEVSNELDMKVVTKWGMTKGKDIPKDVLASMPEDIAYLLTERPEATLGQALKLKYE